MTQIRREFYYRMCNRAEMQLSEIALNALWHYAGLCAIRYCRLFRYSY